MQELKNKEAAVVVFSGGQDSTTCLFWALKRYKKVIALSFDYHQKHVKELECAKKICRDHEVEHHIMDMSLLNQLAPNSLTRVDIKVDENAPEEGTPNSFVDGRNLLFLSYAAVFAKQRGITDIITGVSQSDFSGYPDCRDIFIKSLNTTLCLAMNYQFDIITPLMWLDKKGTWALADELGAFDIIKNEYQKCDKSDIYALCFLKYDQNGNNMGNLFKNEKTTMFDLYFKEGENGEKALVFFADVRKKYKHELEHNEKFVTEARMYHKMDVKYKMICINKPIMICEYQKDGYSKNIIKQFKNNPYGYYKYFQEILEKDMKGVKFSKRLYVIKHYILFGKLINAKKSLNKIMSTKNKILYCLLYVPGRIKTKMKFDVKKI